MALSSEESGAIAELHAFKHPKEGWLDRVGELADAGLSKAADRVFDTAMGERAEGAVADIARALNDAAIWTVRRSAILQDYRDDGVEVEGIDDVAQLGLGQIRQTLGRLDLKYRLLSTLEGAAAGAVGALGIALDVPALVTLSLRAINEYATYFGFDSDLPHERYYALLVLATAASGGDGSRVQALAEITRVGQELSRSDTPLPNLVPDEGLIDRLAALLAAQFGRGKLAQVVPVVGAVIGGGFNSGFLADVCHTAEMLYMERWLLRRHGPDVALSAT